MHKVQRMDPILGPPNCLICNRGNNADDPDTMDDFWVLDMERDVNWGDPAYICKYCCELIAAEVGFVPHETVVQLEEVVKDKNKEIHQIEAERDSLRRRFRSTKLGKKALRSAREQTA
jgi:hypothetical protein